MVKSNKSKYHFWRWLILKIVQTPKLYVLVWGILIAALVIFVKADLSLLIKGILL